LHSSDVYAPQWRDEDVKWLKDIFEKKDPMGLSLIAARDDLFVIDGDKKIKLGVFILKNVDLGASLLDFNNPWTVQRLRDYVGFDMQGEKAALLTKPQALKRDATLKTHAAG